MPPLKYLTKLQTGVFSATHRVTVVCICVKLDSLQLYHTYGPDISLQTHALSNGWTGNTVSPTAFLNGMGEKKKKMERRGGGRRANKYGEMWNHNNVGSITTLINIITQIMTQPIVQSALLRCIKVLPSSTIATTRSSNLTVTGINTWRYSLHPHPTPTAGTVVCVGAQ